MNVGCRCILYQKNIRDLEVLHLMDHHKFSDLFFFMYVEVYLNALCILKMAARRVLLLIGGNIMNIIYMLQSASTSEVIVWNV